MIPRLSGLTMDTVIHAIEKSRRISYFKAGKPPAKERGACFFPRGRELFLLFSSSQFLH